MAGRTKTISGAHGDGIIQAGLCLLLAGPTMTGAAAVSASPSPFTARLTVPMTLPPAPPHRTAKAAHRPAPAVHRPRSVRHFAYRRLLPMPVRVVKVVQVKVLTRYVPILSRPGPMLVQAAEAGDQSLVAADLRESGITRQDRNAALVSASLMNHKEVVQLLLNAGADVNARQQDGQTALILAIAKDNKSIIHVLLDGGANVNLWDNNRWTALMYAAANDHTDEVRWLLDKRAAVNVRGKDGATALSLAFDHSGGEMQSALQGAEARR